LAGQCPHDGDALLLADMLSTLFVDVLRGVPTILVVLTMAVASAPTTMMVETVAIVVSRRARRRRAASRAARRSTVVAGVLSGAARRHGEGEGRRTGERGAGAWPRS
jgi:hypothetical protein